MAGPDFVHLHVHSSYSLLEGALTIGRLAELAKADRQPALALTDTDNMFGALEFSEKMASSGIQPIIGCALAVDFGDVDHRCAAQWRRPHSRLVLLAAREEGYRSLMRLNSRAFLETPSNEAPHLKLAWLAGETDGIIALTGGPSGPLDTAIAAGQSHLAQSRLRQAAGAVRRPALCRAAAARHAGGAGDRAGLGRSRLPGGHCRWSRPTSRSSRPREDYEAHDALICIAEGR